MGKIYLETGWRQAEFDSCEAEDYKKIEARFKNAAGKNREMETPQRLYDISRFPAQVHDVLLEHGEIENPNEKGVNPLELSII